MTGIRDQFPIFAAQPAPFHYLDNAATGQICRAAAEALWQFETTARANVKRGVYRLADEATVAFQTARARVAAYLGAADADEVIFTSGCTLAINTAAHALAPRLRPGDEILVSRARASQQHRALADGGRARRCPHARDPGHRGGPARLRPAGRRWSPRAPASSPSPTPPTSPGP